MTTSPAEPPESTLAAVVEYVVGFAFDTDGRVALIRKSRPEWQAGRLNGIGGHVEATDRTPWGAMCREWCEETGQPTPANWREFVVMDFPGARIHFFTALGIAPEWLDACHTTTDEEVCLVTVGDANQHLLIPNLVWLIPLARYTADDYRPIHVEASTAERADAFIAATPTAARIARLEADLAAALAKLAAVEALADRWAEDDTYPEADQDFWAHPLGCAADELRALTTQPAP